jgi:hypothetical protein
MWRERRTTFGQSAAAWANAAHCSDGVVLNVCVTRPVGQPRVAQRLGFVDATTQRRQDPLDRVAQIGRRREAHVGALESPAALDPHRPQAVDHHLVDYGVAQQRLERPQPERPLGHPRHQRLARARIEQRRLALHQRPDPPLDVARGLRPRLGQQRLAQRGCERVEVGDRLHTTTSPVGARLSPTARSVPAISRPRRRR